MRKKIRNWGGSLVIRFSPDDKELFDIEEGDTIEIPDEILKKVRKNNGGNK
jgi:antitoxin component of MazEF toxin-antitoxin module